MRKGITTFEVMVFVCIILILIGMLVPAFSLISKRTGQTINGVQVKYSDIIGKTINWNGNTVFVTYYNGNSYKIVVNGNVTVDADRKAIFEAYKKQLENKIETDN